LTIIANNNKKKKGSSHPHFTVKVENNKQVKLVCGFACSEYYSPEANPLLNGSFGNDNLNLGTGMTKKLIVNIRNSGGGIETYRPDKVAKFIGQLLIRCSRLEYLRLQDDVQGFG
jgi:hypothetical protein